tara:strand:- start:370 stop:627 length:258 start_codon:yes stop_codon:yes gene_type:complete
MKIKYIATAKEWFDKVNGNSYFSVRIKDLKTNKTIYLPFQYGYGTKYEQETQEALGLKMRMSELPIDFTKIENCKQKEVKEWGKE